MPISHGYTTKNGRRKGYYQFDSKKKFYYEPGSKDEREEAKRKAHEQAYAAGYNWEGTKKRDEGG